MANTRAIEEKIQTNMDPDTKEIESNSTAESKEEKKSAALVEMKKHTPSYLDKQLAASFVAAFNALCFTPSSRSPIKISLLLFLGRIPTEVLLNHFLPYLDLKSNANDYYNMVGVERPIGSLFRKHLADLHLTQLLQHIAYGEKVQTEKILQHRPDLLLLSGPIVKDYAGREIQQTAYQISLAAGDVFVTFKDGVYQPEAKGEGMKEMIDRYFIKLLGEEKGIAELERQRKMILPDDFEEYLKQLRAEDLAAVTEIFNAIGNAETIDEEGLMEECGKALKKFKTYLEPKGIITTSTPGYHFDAQILVEAYGLYDANYKNFGDDLYSPKNLFAWQKVIGLIQRYLTACDAMVLCQGTFYFVHGGEKFRRTLNFRFDDGVYFPIDTNPAFLFGKNAAVPGKSAALPLPAHIASKDGRLLEILCRAKTSSLRKPMQRSDNQSKTRCVIM